MSHRLVVTIMTTAVGHARDVYPTFNVQLLVAISKAVSRFVVPTESVREVERYQEDQRYPEYEKTSLEDFRSKLKCSL